MMADPEKKICIHHFTSIIASAHSLSFLMKSTLAGFQNSGMWPFSINDFGDEDFQVATVVCGGSNEPSIVTAQSRGLTSS